MSPVMNAVQYNGVFTAPMGFQRFPSDRQSLPITIHLAHDGVMALKRRQVLLQPTVSLGPEITQRIAAQSPKDTLSGWCARPLAERLSSLRCHTMAVLHCCRWAVVVVTRWRCAAGTS